jgi:radical SAM protein with 4Fe4S-binding SPASM domain
MLEMDLFRKLIDQVHKKVFYLTFYFQGEPFLNPLFLDMVRYASEKKLYTATSTNAHYLSEETARRTVESGIDRVIISIDGTTQDTYSSYRVGGSLQKVLEGTNRLVYWKRKLKSAKPYLIFQFLVVRPNEHQIGEIRRLARETGVDKVVFKTAQIYDFKSGNPLIPLNEKYSRYRMQKDGTYRLKNQLINHCWKLWHSSVLTWDGKIVPCCFDKDATHVMGSVDQGSFKELWNSPSYREFRGNLFRNRSETEICRNCSEGAGVWTD